MKLGDWLLGKGKLTRERLARALRDQSFFGGRLGSSLIKLGYIDEDTLGEYLADISSTPYAPARRLENIPPSTTAAVPGRLAARYRIVPMAIRDRTLHLAMRDPKDLIALDEIAFLTGLSIKPYVATEHRIVQAIARYYGISLGTRTIPVAGGAKSRPGRAPAKPAAPASPPGGPRPPEPEVGLDGLPLDADADEFDQPFVSGAAAPPPEWQAEAPLPTSLEEWRMAQEEIPEELPEPPPPPPAARRDTERATARIRVPAGAAAVPAAVARPVPAPGASRPAARTMDEVSARLRASETRDEVFDAVLEYAAPRFHRVALFVVQQDRVIGWSGRGAGLLPLRIRNVTVPLD
ncbi:MAG: hypothetical protein ACE5JH_11440, partial [Acidobacteriota bacterium]